MKIPIILGQPLHLWLGILLLILIVLQIAGVSKILPISFKWHRIIGYVIFILAIIHGLLAAGLNFGIFTL
ncbi:MAG: hypothetical protein AB9883_08450 [Acidaminococcaceae bacterium]